LPTVGTDTHTLTINNQISEIRRMSQWLETTSQQLGLPADSIFKFDLCANEAVTNVISYAFPENGDHEITLRLSVDHQAASLVIEDDGTPFNPLDTPDHVQPASLEEASIGGLGIDLIRRMMDECDYAYRSGRNILRMTVNLS
jgi:serine/threonine-protein kinase RsbW